MTRHRSRTFVSHSGGKAVPIPSYLHGYDQSNALATQHCYDELGPGDPHPLLITLDDHWYGVISGQPSRYFNVTNWHGIWGPLVVPDMGCPEVADAALMGMAKTNINSTVVDVPVFLAELRDLPDMLRHLGNRLTRLTSFAKTRKGSYSLKDLAEDNLVLNFGWSPLFQDLGKMLDFVGDVDKRLNQLDRLYSDRGLRRMQTVYNNEIVDSHSMDAYPFANYGADARVRIWLTTSASMWVSTNWKPASKPTFKTDQEKLDLARRLCYGFNGIEASSIWNAMPWTWLTDWFYHVGDFWAAHRNSVPTECTEVCVMRKTTVKATRYEWLYKPNRPVTFRLKRTPLYTEKCRWVSSPLVAPSIHLPFLSGKQLSILSSLAFTQRFGKIG